MRFIIGFTLVLVLVACAQNIHVKSTKPVSKAIIDDQDIGPVGPEGRDAMVPVNFGAAKFSLYENDVLVGHGLLPRSQINPWSFGLSVGGAMVLTPTFALTGALAANPSWIFASSVFLQGGGIGSFWAYLAQTASFWTFPAALLGAAIGLLPLLGLTYSERLPDVVLLTTPDFARR